MASMSQLSTAIGWLADRSTATGAMRRPMADVTPAPVGQMIRLMPSLRAMP